MPSSSLYTVRSEHAGDAGAIRRVHETAFPTDAEARLVDRLRAAGKALVSLVAVVDGQIVGHVLFSPVSIDGASTVRDGVGLAPVAVLPDYQRRGLGSDLIRAGLAQCTQTSYGFVVVLGDPSFYRRFGCHRASDFRLGNDYGADETFLVLELRPGALPAAGGHVRYAPEFADSAA